MADRDDSLRAKLAAAKAKGPALRYCVAGAGNGGLAMAGHLGLMGFDVVLYNRSDEKLAGVRWHGGVQVEGVIEGLGRVRLATSDIEGALSGVDVIMVVTPSTAHRPLSLLMAPFLVEGQVVVLNPGRTGGALEFRQGLIEAGCQAAVVIAEAQTFLYASRALSRHKARIFSIKKRVPLAALPSYWTPDALSILALAFPQFTSGTNVLATSMENIGAIFHPALTILNAGWIEGTKGDFDYYLDGITPSIARVLEEMDAERIAVARALGVNSLSAREWLYTSYGSPGESLFEAIKNTDSYRGIKAPASINHRYVTEDLPMSLVPISSIGRMLGVPTPRMDMIIELGSFLLGLDFRATGRTVERLGLSGLDLKAIHRIVVDPPDADNPREGKR